LLPEGRGPSWIDSERPKFPEIWWVKCGCPVRLDLDPIG
jgi:hypothetical protein